MKIALHNEKWKNFYLFVLFFSFIIFLWAMHVEYYHLKIAWSGFSPVGWIAERNFPENFLRGFPTGLVGLYEKSLPMHIYILTNGFIPTIVMAKVMMLLEIMLLYVLAYFYARKFSSSNNLLFKTFIVGTVLAFSDARVFDWGRWMSPFIVGQFYTIADFLRGMAFLMCLDSKYIISSIYSALCLCTHPLMALTGIFANIVSLVPVCRSINTKKLSLGLIIILSVSIIWYLLFFRTANVIQADGIPNKEWFFMTRLLSCHWFPDSLGVLTTNFQGYVMPFLSFSVLLFVSIKKNYFVQKYFCRFVSVYIGIMVLVVIGILNAYFEWSVFITKMALQRSNEFLLLIGVPIIVLLLLEQWDSASSILKISIAFVLLSLFFMDLPWFPPMVLLYLFVVGWPKWKFPLFTSSVFLLIYLLYKIFMVNFSSIHIRPELLVMWLLMAGIIVYMRISKKKNYYSMLSLSIIIGISAFFYVQANRISAVEKELYQDFYDAQIWAKNNTSVQSLFVVDPLIFYGWRDYSERSSLGNLREWLHISILYNSNQKIYSRGMEIFNKLEVDSHNYMKRDGWTYDVLVSDFYNDVEKSFYRKNGVVNIAFSLINQKDVFYVLLKSKTHCRPVSKYENHSIIIVEQKSILDLDKTECFMN